MFVAGSAIFSQANYKIAIDEMREQLSQVSL
jgi:ribulose-phosphate 3-epimerase